MSDADIIWTQKDKRKIRWGDMTTSHLNNCIKLLRRRVCEEWSECSAASGYSGNGEEASACAASAADYAAYCAANLEAWADRMENYVAREHLQNSDKKLVYCV